MIKIFFRFIMILLAAGIVAGGLYIYAASADSNQGNMDVRSGSITEGQGLPAGGDYTGKQFEGGGPGEGDMGRGHEGGESGSLHGGLGILTQIGKIAIITIVICGVQGLIKLFRRNHKRHVITSGTV